VRRSPISSIAEKLLDIARQELGYTVASGQQSKYGTWYAAGKDPAFASAPWCDTFVSWAAGKAGVGASVGAFAYVPDHAQWFKKQQAWATTPQTGAVAFLKGDGHVGIVEQVSDGHVHTIEAVGGTVQRVVREADEISGYGIPDRVEHAVYRGSTTASYFWDDGSGINGDTGAPYSGNPMQKGLAASPSWPMGTKGYVIYQGRKAEFFVGDLGPGNPSDRGVMLDLDGKTFADLTGGTWNHPERMVEGNGGLGHIPVEYVITEWGPGPGKKGEPVPFRTGAYKKMDNSVPRTATPAFPVADAARLSGTCAADGTTATSLSMKVMSAVSPLTSDSALPFSALSAVLMVCVAGAVGVRTLTRRIPWRRRSR
jgi:hypothetical protein